MRSQKQIRRMRKEVMAELGKPITWFCVYMALYLAGCINPTFNLFNVQRSAEDKASPSEEVWHDANTGEVVSESP